MFVVRVTGERVQILRIVVRTITFVGKWRDLYTKSLFHDPEHYYFQENNGQARDMLILFSSIRWLIMLQQCF